LHDEASLAQVGRQRQQRGDDECRGGGAADRGNHAAHGATGQTEVERPSHREIDTVDDRLGHTGEEARSGARQSNLTAGLRLRPDGDRNGRRGLGEHGRRQRAGQQGVTEGAEVIDDHRNQTPVQTEDHQHLPQATDDRAGSPRGVDEEELNTGRNTAGDHRGDGSDNDECERHHHQHGDQRDGEVADHGGQSLGQYPLQMPLNPHREDDRDDR